MSLFLSLSCMVGGGGGGGLLWDLCECQAEFGTSLQRSVRQISHFFCCVDKKNVCKPE